AIHAPVADSVAAPLRQLANVVLAAAALTITLGTVVTGSGPHAGDRLARRTGLNPGAVAQLHADGVFLLIGLSVAIWLALRAAGVGAGWLVAVEAAQGVVGYAQYRTHLPPLIVGLHLAGACAVWLAALALWHATRPAEPRA